ncbi:MAG: hypothetical protein ACREBC_32215, partial [Pyrinomonadaceae bacterium]
LVEARAGSMGLWESLAVPRLTEMGKSAQDVAKLFETQTEEAKDFAYGLAEEITLRLEAQEADSETPALEDDDRQGRLVYDHTDTREA